jgi:hypothetical protein
MESSFILIWQIIKFFKNHTLQFQTKTEVTIQKTSFYINWNISKCFSDQKYFIKFTMETDVYAAIIFYLAKAKLEKLYCSATQSLSFKGWDNSLI